MVTYYTAIGKMITKDDNGTKVPVILVEGSEFTEIKSEDEIIDKLYNDGKTTYESIAVQARFSELKLNIIKTVVNLYLKRKLYSKTKRCILRDAFFYVIYENYCFKKRNRSVDLKLLENKNERIIQIFLLLNFQVIKSLNSFWYISLYLFGLVP